MSALQSAAPAQARARRTASGWMAAGVAAALLGLALLLDNDFYLRILFMEACITCVRQG
ncbi:Uncharacterised protein [Bordetella trematum]|nr:Uncharacterised protein [Bordetella trematum]